MATDDLSEEILEMLKRVPPEYWSIWRGKNYTVKGLILAEKGEARDLVSWCSMELDIRDTKVSLGTAGAQAYDDLLERVERLEIVAVRERLRDVLTRRGFLP